MKVNVLVEIESKDSSQKTINTELCASLVITVSVWEKGRCLSMGMEMQCPLPPLNEDIPGEWRISFMKFL